MEYQLERIIDISKAIAGLLIYRQIKAIPGVANIENIITFILLMILGTAVAFL